MLSLGFWRGVVLVCGFYFLFWLVLVWGERWVRGVFFAFFFQVSKLGLTIGFSGGISPLLQEFSLNRLIPTLLCDFPGTDICCLNHVGGMIVGSLCNHCCLSSRRQFKLGVSDDIIKLPFLPAYVLK